ncbi:alanyl-tRNA synthetase [uncultured bacterium]|nr:alanyl-tRNA synthetase [uncultured bacterium]
MNIDNLMMTFIYFFKNRGYNFLIRNNIINYSNNNQDLLFINSGIAGILDKFNNEKINKLITVQTCLRIDGKHNDFENIGNSKSHFSAFKMLGTFSNNNTDIFSMIKDIYDFIVQLIPFKSIYITVHKDDNISREIWNKIDKKLEIIEDNNNIWSMGNIGPQGYCTEIYYYENNDKRNATELWNIVIINKIILDTGEIIYKKNLGIDTGGGLERIYSVFDDKHDVYLIDGMFEITNYLLNFFSFDNSKIILDSIKSISLLLDNNVVISNNKHGYVLKKIFRKLIYTLMQNQEFKEEEIIYIFSKHIKKIREFLYILKNETIAVKRCDEILINHVNKKTDKLEIIDIVKLHDTYGVHYTHTLNFIKNKYQNDCNYNIEDIQNSLYKTSIKNKNNIDLKINFKNTEFLYDLNELQISENFIIYDSDLKQALSSIKQDQKFCIINEKTIFYPESGGQKYDIGEIIYNDVVIATITKVIKIKNYILHYCISHQNIIASNFKLYKMKIDVKRRKILANSHSIHHLLIYVIENLLCEKVFQQSSNIDIDKTTMSFYSIRKLSQIINEDQLSRHLQYIVDNIGKICVNNVDTEFAIQSGYKSIMTGYDTNSRVIEIYNKQNQLISKELCCGTHLIDKNIKVKIDKIIEQNSYITKITFRLIN